MTSIDDPQLFVIQTRSTTSNGCATVREERVVFEARGEQPSQGKQRKHSEGQAPPQAARAAQRAHDRRNIPVAPNNVGPKTIPNYDAVANQAITELPGGGKVFAGPA